MDKDLKQLLVDIDFAPRYLELWNQNKMLAGNPHLLKEEIIDIFNALDFPVNFNSKEKFFKHLETDQETDFQLNVNVRPNFVEFILYVSSEKHKISAGDPYGSFANELDKNLKVYPKIAFNDYESLQEVLKIGINLFREIKAGYVKQLLTK